MSSYGDVKAWRKLNKARLVAGFGRKCAVCGLRDDPIVYDFHHLDPGGKDDNVTRQIQAWDRTVEEAKKCVLLCSPCHRKVHAGMVVVPEDYQRFDESLIDSNLPEYLFDTCPICQGRKKISALTCSMQCGMKKRETKLDWDSYDLKEMYARLGSYIGVAREIGNVSDVTVKRRLKIQSSCA